MATFLSALQLAQVARILYDEGISAGDPLFTTRFRTALGIVLGGGVAGRTDLTNISLPDIEQDTGVDIVPDNLRALSALYFTAMLEDLKFFAVADKVAEQFMQGMLPISRGAGGDSIYHYVRSSPERFSEAELHRVRGELLAARRSAAASSRAASASRRARSTSRCPTASSPICGSGSCRRSACGTGCRTRRSAAS